jgi:hypothetical protein
LIPRSSRASCLNFLCKSHHTHGYIVCRWRTHLLELSYYILMIIFITLLTDATTCINLASPA